MKNILVVCPTHRDLRELSKEKISSDYNIIFYGNDASEQLETFDPIAFIDEVLMKFKNNSLDGVISTDDYPGCIISNIVAREFGLPFVDPEKVLLCQHKYYSRQAQLKSVSESVPKFALINPYAQNSRKLEFKFPFFIKPVKSFFSVFANKVENYTEFHRILESAKSHLPKFVIPFNQLLEKYTNFELNANYLLAEQLLEGQQITLEGYVYNNKVEILGIVDSVMFPNTISFERFNYPSNLNKEIQNRMAEITEKFIGSIGFNNGIFDIEMLYNPKTEEISIIEINPRMASQFADIMEKVDGTNTYEIQLALSVGEKPYFKRNSGKYKTASSFVLRTFEDKKIIKLPTKGQIEKLEKKFPGIRIEIFGKEGTMLSDELQDGKSYRFGLINLGSESKKDLLRKFEECKKILGFKFEESLNELDINL